MKQTLGLLFAKISMFISSLLLLYFPFTSLWFTLTASIFFGNLYYWATETHPILIMCMTILVRHRLRNLYTYIITVATNGARRVYDVKLEAQLIERSNVGSSGAAERYNSLTYHNDGKKFIYLFKTSHASNDLVIVKDQNNIDVTDMVEPYLGPCLDFHGASLTPSDIGYESLTIFKDGESEFYKTFTKNEVMHF